jgi:hypothetical protein
MYYVVSLSSPSSFSRPAFQSSNFRYMLADQSRYVKQLCNNGQDAYHGGPPWSSP